MTDLDPAQTEAVRRALAAARHDQPIPAEVAARLDATLAGLVAEDAVPAVAAAMVASAPAEPARVAAVIPLRRRRLPVLLVAAAAVVAAAVATPQLLDRSDEQPTIAAHDDRPTVLSDRAEAVRPSDAQAPAPELSSTLSALGVTELRDTTLADDLANLLQQNRTQQKSLDSVPLNGAADQDSAATVDAPDAYSTAIPTCGPAEPPAGSRLFQARYRGHPAVVIALPVTGDVTPVEVYDCRIAPRVPAQVLLVPRAD
jgi:hypothetical protein